MAEVFFYHLGEQPLNLVLPKLVARGLNQKLKMAIQSTEKTRLSVLSELLWAAEDVAFLPHGFSDDDYAASQPLILTSSNENPNGATYRFYVDGAVSESMEGLARAMIMFDGADEQALVQARNEWKRLKAEGHKISYWKQDEGGKWQNQASQ